MGEEGEKQQEQEQEERRVLPPAGHSCSFLHLEHGDKCLITPVWRMRNVK